MLTPAQAVDRVNEILESKTVLDEVKERRMILVRMSEHLDWLETHRENDKAWGAIAKMYKLVSDQVERANLSLTDVSTKLASDQAGFFVQGFVVGFEMILKRLKEAGEIEIDEEEIVQLMKAGTKASEEYIESVTQREAIDA